ncbi:hypothetical protein KM043_009235 [Ampulex compressa]|nr:hypothetical protein KM043_009235 [Ampulex compressa]
MQLDADGINRGPIEGSPDTMESWLSDVQRVRIPRPKFGSGNSVRRSNSSIQHVRPEVPSRQGQDVAKATEELRQALQDKL